MITINSDFIAAFDVDNTLITPEKNNPHPDDVLSIVDPYTNTTKKRIAYKPNIELMKSYRSRGYTIVVWSHGGYRWAEAVVKALNLQNIVDYCQAKPSKMVDDLPVDKGIGQTIFVYED